MPLESIYSSKNKHLCQACPGVEVRTSEKNSGKIFSFLCVYFILLGRHTNKQIAKYIHICGLDNIKCNRENFIYILYSHIHPSAFFILYLFIYGCPGPSSKKLFSKETYLCRLILSGLGSDVILWGRPCTWYHTLSEVNSQFHHK